MDNMNDLTKDQKILLIALYKEFLSRQPALNPSRANYFVDVESTLPLLGLKFDLDYADDMFLALLERGYIVGNESDLSVDEFGISDKTIIYMENRFKNGLKEIISFLAPFIP